MSVTIRVTVLACLALAATGGARAAARQDQILIMGNPQGSQTRRGAGGGATRAEFSFNDRGRGDHIVATWKLDAAGVPTEYQGSGNDYMKAPVDRDVPPRRRPRQLAQPRGAWRARR